MKFIGMKKIIGDFWREREKKKGSWRWRKRQIENRRKQETHR